MARCADHDPPLSLTVETARGALTLVLADEAAGYVGFGVCFRALAR
jgi:hypothetical protein